MIIQENDIFCFNCRTTKPIIDFPFNGFKIKKTCNDCYKSLYGNAEEIRIKKNKKIKEKTLLNRNKCRTFIANLLSKNKCMDCGETNPLTLDFDHRDPKTKIGSICELVASGREQILITEVEKCDIVCSNCHMKRTIKQFNHWKNRFYDYVDIDNNKE